jgi:hypothetical protein
MSARFKFTSYSSCGSWMNVEMYSMCLIVFLTRSWGRCPIILYIFDIAKMTKGGRAFRMLAKTEFCTVASSKSRHFVGKVINCVAFRIQDPRSSGFWTLDPDPGCVFRIPGPKTIFLRACYNFWVVGRSSLVVRASDWQWQSRNKSKVHSQHPPIQGNQCWKKYTKNPQNPPYLTIFGQKYMNSLSVVSKLCLFLRFVNLVATKKVKTTTPPPPPPPSFLLMLDPNGKKPGSGINIPNPQHSLASKLRHWFPKPNMVSFKCIYRPC